MAGFFVTYEQLDNAFSSLTTKTRQLVEEEMGHAARDTAMEYHKNTGDIAQKLWNELQGLQACRASIERVQLEYDEITRKDQNNDPDHEGSVDSLGVWRIPS